MFVLENASVKDILSVLAVNIPGLYRSQEHRAVQLTKSAYTVSNMLHSLFENVLNELKYILNGKCPVSWQVYNYLSKELSVKLRIRCNL